MLDSYKNLTVWQKSVELVLAVYEVTERFPRSEMYGLTVQMRKAAVSIPSNIAEGKMRGTRRDYRHFLLNSYGSGAELETQVHIAKLLTFGRALDWSRVDGLLNETMRMLNVLIRKLDLVPEAVVSGQEANDLKPIT